MFRLKSIQLENFGPFKGKQRLDLPADDGVVIVYGENMRGKTTLLNAIRFAFFGKFVGRGSRAVPLAKVGNWEAAEEGSFGFEVRLEMVYEGVGYRLTRTCRLRNKNVPPSNDDDFVVDNFMERDGVPLAALEAKRELERILPEQISRFFLFDGELLQEYEDLLLSESEVGAKIAASIERILGMPVLTRARDGLAMAKDQAEKIQATAAQGDQKTQQLGNALSSLLAFHATYLEDLQRLEKKLGDLRHKKTSLEEAMRKNERIRSILEKRDFLITEKAQLEARLLDEQSQAQSAMGTAWAVILRDRMDAALADLRKKQQDLQAEALRTEVLKSLAEQHVVNCPTCQQSIGENARVHLSKLLADRDTKAEADISSALATVNSQIAALQKHLAGSNPQALRLQLDKTADLQRDIYSRGQEIKDLDGKLADVDEDDVRQVKHEHETVIKEIKTQEDGVAATKIKLSENEASRDSIQAKLIKIGGSGLETAQQRYKITSDLYDLLDQSVAHYRERLRHRVQEDASAHFRALTTEAEYTGLRINDSYGLSIVHKSGGEIPLRSAGAEHVVALSLVAALQNNAPLRGPIIIDSPFVRLDSGHKDRIVHALPDFASQVLMLVYEDEMPPTRARKALEGHLKGEFKLDRISARHTNLTARVN